MGDLQLRFSEALQELCSKHYDRAAEQLEGLLVELAIEGSWDDQRALQVRRPLVLAYSQLGRFEEAAELAERNVAAYLQLLGSEDLETLRAQEDLAIAYARINRRDEAMVRMTETLRSWRELMGADYCDTLYCQYSLARLLWEAGRRDEATVLYEQTLAACQRALGSDDSLTREVAEVVAAIDDGAG